MLLLEKIKQFFSNKEAKDINIAISQSNLNNEQGVNNHNVFEIEDGIINYDPFQIYEFSGNNLLVTIDMMNQKIKEWRMMSEIPEVDDAIDTIVNEIISFDGVNNPIKINLDNLEISKNIKDKIQNSFDKFLKLLNFNLTGYETIRQFYVDGQLNYKVIYDETNKKNGIIDIIKLTPFYFYKYIDNKTKELYWFYNYQQKFSNLLNGYKNAENVFYDEEIVHTDTGKFSFDAKFPLSYLNKAIKPINQLTLIEDSLIIYRITRAPERRVFNVDVGNLPKNKAEQYVQNLIRKYRQKNVYNIKTGKIEGATKTISILEDYWFPKTANGRGSTVDTLQAGNLNFSEIDDVEYFVKKVYKAMGVPWSRKDTQSTINFSASSEIERDEIKFFKHIIRIRRRLEVLFLEFLKRDLLYTKTFSLNDWENIKSNIKFIFNSDNDYAEIKNLDKLSNKFEVVNTASSLKDDGYLSKEWIYKNILKFTDEEIKEIKEQIKKENENDNNEEE